MRNVVIALSRTLALGTLLAAAAAAVGKPPSPPTQAGCPTCEIAYTQSNQDLMLMKTDGSTVTKLLSGGSGIQHKGPVWAPGGNWIAFITNADASSTLRLIRSAGTGLTTVVERCTLRWTRPAWNPEPTGGGYWLVYTAARDAEGNCIVAPVPGTSRPSENLWAIHVSLGSPILLGTPVCLTCQMNPRNQDLWGYLAWSGGGTHLSALQLRYDATGMAASFYIFDVTMTGVVPALAPAEPFVLQDFSYPSSSVPASWAHLSDSLFWSTKDEATGTHDLRKLDLALSGIHEITGTTVLTTGSTHNFLEAVWSPDDSQFVHEEGGGIYVTTIAPFSSKLIAPPGKQGRVLNTPDWKPSVH